MTYKVFDANTFRYWCYLAVLYFMNETLIHSWLYTFIIYVLGSILIDFLYYYYGYVFYDPEIVIERGYNWSLLFNDAPHSQGLDYGFNFYNGDLKKPRRQAQIDKFEYAIKQLGITKGSKVLDVGCGCGDWINYLKTKWNCEVAGVNITSGQVAACRGRGLEVYHSNWKDVKNNPELRNKLYGRFDVVSFWDTVEHYVPLCTLGKRDQQNAIYMDMYDLALKCLNPKSKIQKVWISCLHMRKQVISHFSSMTLKLWRKAIYIYILDKFHSGFYPSSYVDRITKQKRDQLVENAEAKGLKCTWRKDVTFDYYFTSVQEPEHFGRHKFKWTPQRIWYALLVAAVDPFWMHRYAWFYFEDWMLQFDEKDINNSDVILWWLIFEKNQ